MNDLEKRIANAEKYRKQANICFNCQRACGDCPWSEIDPETDKPRFQPVPGWTAKRVILRMNVRKGSSEFVDTYSITACPMFIPDKRGSTKKEAAKNGPRECAICGKLFKPFNINAKYCSELCRAKAAYIRNREYQKMTRNAPRKKPKNGKAVISTDIETGKETRYTSMTDAAEEVNGSQGRISTACMNGSPYRGCYWRKENDVDFC